MALAPVDNVARVDGVRQELVERTPGEGDAAHGAAAGERAAAGHEAQPVHLRLDGAARCRACGKARRCAARCRLGRLCKGIAVERAHVAGMARFDVSDAQWDQLAPLLPPRRPATGRPNHDHRCILNGMLWVLRTGAPWADLPARCGTVSSRFYRWRAAGIIAGVLKRLQTSADARGAIDWNLHFVDATVIRAHQHAAGARRAGAIGG